MKVMRDVVSSEGAVGSVGVPPHRGESVLGTGHHEAALMGGEIPYGDLQPMRGVGERHHQLITGFMKSVSRFVETTGPSGLGEPAGNGLPSFWMKAKLTYSVLTFCWQARLLFCPVFALSSKVSMFSAASHCVAVPLVFTHPGG